MAFRFYPIHKIPTLRNALPTDEMEVQAQNGGPSARVPASSINFGGPTGPAGPSIWPSPYDFGAVGNGTTDDTTALQAWLDAIAGGTGYLKSKNLSDVQKGIFLFSAVLTVHSNTHIVGDGPLVSQLKAAASMSNTTFLHNEHRTISGPADKAIIFEHFSVNGALATAVGWPISSISVARETGAGGSAYAVNDTGTILTGGMNATYRVTSVSAGVVTGVTLTGAGTGYYTIGAVATADAGGQPGVGTGLMLTIGADRSSEIMPLYFVQDCVFNDFTLMNTTFRGLTLYSATNTRIQACTFDSVPNAVDIITVQGEFTGANSVDNKVLGCTFRNNKGTSIVIEGGDTFWVAVGTVIEGNTIRDQGGTFIFADQFNVGTVINGNYLFNNYFYWDNGTGCELQGSNLAFTNNVMLYSAWYCVNFFSCLGVTVTGNQFFYPGQSENPPPNGPDSSSCVLFYIEQSSSIGNDIIVANNTCVANTSGTVDGIRFRGFAGMTSRFHNVLVSQNMTFGSTWLTGGVVIDNIPVTSTSVWDNSCRRKDNWATEDCDPFTVHILLPAGTATDFPITGCPFRPRSASIVATLSTLSDIANSTCEVAPDLSAVSNSNAASAGGYYCTTSDTATGGFAINLHDGAGTVLCHANVTAYTQDGLIITPAVGTGPNIWLTVTMRP